MKAAQLTKYDKKNPTIEIKDIPEPIIDENDVLVKVIFAAVNPLDNLISHGNLKLVTPYHLPQTMGNEFVGIIEQVGSKVSKFKIGERIYGRNPISNIGAFAEKLKINQKYIASVPEYLTDQQAAAVPLTALTTIQALNLLESHPGDTLFISGGTGSFGAMAIPIAKSYGLKVITSGNVKKEKVVRNLGVDQFIDYKNEDYTKLLSNVDLVIDTVGMKEIFNEMSILKNGGKIVSLRAVPNAAFAKRMKMGIFKQMLFRIGAHKINKISKKRNQVYNFVFVTADGKQLKEVNTILSKKKIIPEIGNIYSLQEVNQALEEVNSGNGKGKVLIKM